MRIHPFHAPKGRNVREQHQQIALVEVAFILQRRWCAWILLQFLVHGQQLVDDGQKRLRFIGALPKYDGVAGDAEQYLKSSRRIIHFTIDENHRVRGGRADYVDI